MLKKTKSSLSDLTDFDDYVMSKSNSVEFMIYEKSYYVWIIRSVFEFNDCTIAHLLKQYTNEKEPHFAFTIHQIDYNILSKENKELILMKLKEQIESSYEKNAVRAQKINH